MIQKEIHINKSKRMYVCKEKKMKRVTYVFELKEAEISEIGNCAMSGFNRDDELHQLHLFRT